MKQNIQNNTSYLAYFGKYPLNTNPSFIDDNLRKEKALEEKVNLYQRVLGADTICQGTDTPQFEKAVQLLDELDVSLSVLEQNTTLNPKQEDKIKKFREVYQKAGTWEFETRLMYGINKVVINVGDSIANNYAVNIRKLIEKIFKRANISLYEKEVSYYKLLYQREGLPKIYERNLSHKLNSEYPANTIMIIT
jgi:hypothetical protein